MFFPLKMVIFRCYVSSPEGNGRHCRISCRSSHPAEALMRTFWPVASWSRQAPWAQNVCLKNHLDGHPSLCSHMNTYCHECHKPQNSGDCVFCLLELELEQTHCDHQVAGFWAFVRPPFVCSWGSRCHPGIPAATTLTKKQQVLYQLAHGRASLQQVWNEFFPLQCNHTKQLGL